MKNKNYQKLGFTLIELLIVIGIVGILAVAGFVALNPGKRLADSRDSRRWSDVTATIDAIKVDQVDNGGAYLIPEMNDTNMVAGTNYMIGTCTGVGACTALACADVTPINAADGVDLTGLTTEGYLAAVPIAPQAAGGPLYTTVLTGYIATKNLNGTMRIRACDYEGSASVIDVQR